MELIGTLFIIAVFVGMYQFLVRKHRNLVDIKPDLFLSAWQAKQTVSYKNLNEYKAHVLVVQKRGY